MKKRNQTYCFFSVKQIASHVQSLVVFCYVINNNDDVSMLCSTFKLLMCSNIDNFNKIDEAEKTKKQTRTTQQTNQITRTTQKM